MAARILIVDGMFKVGDGIGEVRGALVAAARAIRASLGIRCAAAVTFAGIEPPDDADALIDIVDATLRAAAGREDGTFITATLQQEASIAT